MINLIQAEGYNKKGKKAIFILDNASTHRGLNIRKYLYGRYTLFFLPTYSSPLNPIELVFGYLKKRIFKIVRRTVPKLIAAISGNI